MNKDLKVIKELVYDKCAFDFADLKINDESTEYTACSYKINGRIVQHRSSNITPTKTGQFVSIWKRNKDGITQAFDFSDEIDFIIIAARKGDCFGQFIFPKAVLATKGIITYEGMEGKRGIRVYPPWDTVSSKQARKTQSWQIQYFLEIKEDSSIDLELAIKYLS